jgi:hypothetical protein
VRTDSLVIDLDARLAHRDGVPVHLTPTEWRVLSALIRQPGTLIRQADLAAACLDQATRQRDERVSFGSGASGLRGGASGPVDHGRHRNAGQQEHHDDGGVPRIGDGQRVVRRNEGQVQREAGDHAATTAGSGPPINALATITAIMIMVSKNSGRGPRISRKITSAIGPIGP